MASKHPFPIQGWAGLLWDRIKRLQGGSDVGIRPTLRYGGGPDASEGWGTIMGPDEFERLMVMGVLPDPLGQERKNGRRIHPKGRKTARFGWFRQLLKRLGF